MQKQLKIYFSVRETSIRYGIGSSTIYDWIKAGSFPQPQKLGAKLVRFHIDDLLQWEKEQGRGESFGLPIKEDIEKLSLQ